MKCESDSESSEEFYDAECPRSRGGSLKRSSDVTLINRKQSIEESKDSFYNYVRETEVSNIPGISSSTDLPDEIAKELEVLSGFNTDSNPPNIEILPDSQLSSLQDINVIPTKNPSRIDRLEKIRRGAYGLADENSDNSATNNDAVGGNSDIQYQHDSAESSVEGIYIQGSRPSHPFKVIEPQTLAPNQNVTVDVAALQIRGVSSAIPSDRRSITESLGSERTSSSVSTHRAPVILSGSFRLDKSDSRSSIERNADGLSSSQNLRIENFISQQKFLYCQQLSHIPDDQTPYPKESYVTHPSVNKDVKIINDNQRKNEVKPDEGSSAPKTFIKGFDASSITGKLNLKAVSVSRNSLTRRISSNNSSMETSNVDKLVPAVESDASTNSSIASGFTLNMFQTKGPFTLKSLLKQDQKGHEDSKQLAHEYLNQQHTHGINDTEMIDCKSNSVLNHQSNKSNSRNINVSRTTTQYHSHVNSYPGQCATPRLHDFADPLPSPASAVASLTRDLESDLHQLELRDWAIQGQYVVKPQDEERTRGASSNVSEVIVERDREVGLASDLRQPKSFKDEVISEHSSEDEVATTSVVGRIPTGGSSMGSRSFKENPNSSVMSGGTGSSNNGTGGSGSGKRSIHSSAGGTGSSTSAEATGKTGITKQMNMFLRTKSDSGKRLSDAEILQQIKVKNLDTGEEMDLVKAEDQLPQSINPLSLHIMRLTSEYVSGINQGNRSMDSDTESMISSVSGYELGGKKKTSTMKKLLGTAVKKTTGAAKLVADVAKKGRLKESSHPSGATSIVGKENDVEKIGRLATDIKSCGEIENGLLGSACPPLRDGKALVLKRIQAHKSGPLDFENIQFAQELSSPHLGPIWCMRFSQCGQLLATAGQDKELRIWVLKSSYNHFKDMRNRYTFDTYHSANTSQKSGSPTNSYENVISDQIMASQAEGNNKANQIFVDTPFASYKGHTSDLLDVSWSKNYFILTSSMDKTVRLWHISRKECLCCFQHIDFVTAISFHPRNDQFFLSGSLDGKLRLWNIPEKKVALWNEVETGNNSRLITAVNFIQNGKFAVVGTYDGRCIFYLTDTLKYHTMIHVRSSRGKNSQGRKVTGIEPMPGEDKILITSNDSRIRLYDLRDLSLSCKFKGYSNQSSQIKASFSHDGKYITAGSENQCVYIWRSNPESNNLTVRKDRSSHYEAIKAHNAAVTCSVFAPKPNIILEQLQLQQLETISSDHDSSTHQDPFDASSHSSPNKVFNSGTFPKGGKDKESSTKKESNSSSAKSISGYVLISGDYDGGMNVFLNILKPKHSSLPSASSLSITSN